MLHLQTHFHHPFDGHTSCFPLDYFTVNLQRFSFMTFTVINSKNSVLKYGLQACYKTCHELSYNVINTSNNKHSKDLEALDKEATEQAVQCSMVCLQ